MTLKYLSFSISIAFIYWIVGMALNAALRKTNLYKESLSHLNFIRSEKINNAIGIGLFKWIVKNSFFKFFNQKLKLNTGVEKADLYKLRDEMTISEIDHLIGFVFVTIFAFIKFFQLHFLFGFTIMIVNVLMNFYPSLLQQENKRRVDKLMRRSQSQNSTLTCR
jgi:uncharacterized protein YacL